MYDAGLIFGDEHTFLEDICQGIAKPLYLCRSMGRFTPFTHWDCNFVLFFKFLPREYYATAFYAFNALLLLASLILFSRLIRVAIAGSRDLFASSIVSLSIVAVILTPDFMRVFWHNVFPESRLIALLLLFAVAFRRAAVNDSWKAACVAFIAIVTSIGYKETWLVISLCFALTYVLLGWRTLRRNARILTVLLLVLVVCYIAFYKFWWGLGTQRSYTEGRTISLVNCLYFYFRNPLLIVSAVLASFRLCMVMFKRQRQHLFWDAMLFSGICFALSYAVVGLRNDYYAAPAYAFLIPALAYWLGRVRNRKCLFATITVCASTWFLCSAPKIIQQWKDIHTQRLSDLSFVRELANYKSIRNVYYLLPKRGLFEDWRWYVFNKFYSYAGGKNQSTIEGIKKLSDTEAIVVYNSQANLYFAEELERMTTKSSKSSWYTVFYGSSEPLLIGDETKIEIDHSADAAMSGFYADEKSGRWGKSNDASLDFKVNPNLAKHSLRFNVKAGALTTGKMSQNGLRILINDVEVFYKKVGTLDDIEFELPAGALSSEQINMRFLVDHVVCPYDAVRWHIRSWQKDTRNLGVRFQSLKITAIDKPKEAK